MRDYHGLYKISTRRQSGLSSQVCACVNTAREADSQIWNFKMGGYKPMESCPHMNCARSRWNGTCTTIAVFQILFELGVAVR